MNDDGPRIESRDLSSAIETPSRISRRAAKSDLVASSPIRQTWLEKLARLSLIAGVIALLLAFGSLIALWQRPAQMIALAPAPIQTILPTFIPIPTLTPPPTPTPLPPLVALVAGHSGGEDPGAICPDGLREVEITTEVAQRARQILELRGYRVDILAEFDPRLNASKRDYSPRAFLAIHADSCVYYASGYKVARASNSASPQEDDRLVRCVTSSYAVASQLPFHEGSITTAMTLYHNLMKIDPKSPGAIIELGFLGSDRAILVNKREQLALGIANGIERFLQGSACQ
ncbi:MAG: N-acetylmuramoyl-L-alanine amidase [Anaerolineales bacterium]|nr:N-acetylmuramoyl-L-alanine amidase [Anaerolineales bacterium]